MSYDSCYYGEEQKTEVDSPYGGERRSSSALEDCLAERNRHRHPTNNNNHQHHHNNNNSRNHMMPPAPTSFYDAAYDDVLARKQAAYANNSAPPMYQPPRRNQNHNHSAPETILELGPGVYARLRGASETWHCIEHDFHLPVVCFACSMELCCIQDASYVLCPSCRTVSPIEENEYNNNKSRGGRDDGMDNGGVGLGFTFDELFKWQAEIVRRRAESMRMQAVRNGHHHYDHPYDNHQHHHHHHPQQHGGSAYY
ncbi:hypothetical protein ACA910_022741 [Epithemia clementina (nom. ined.)]